MPSSRIPFSTKDQIFVKQKTEAGGALFLSLPQDTVPLKQDTVNLNKKCLNGRIIAQSGLLRCTIFLFQYWSSFHQIISSFPSLQDVKTALFNEYNLFGRLSLFYKLAIMRQ